MKTFVQKQFKSGKRMAIRSRRLGAMNMPFPPRILIGYDYYIWPGKKMLKGKFMTQKNGKYGQSRISRFIHCNKKYMCPSKLN